MAQPSSRNDFIQYILRRLGEPTIQVNVAPQQLQDRVDDALSLFYKRHFNGTEKVFIMWQLGEDNIDAKSITLPPDVLEVTDVFRPAYSGTIYDLDYQFQLSELYSLSSMYRYGDISYYYMGKMHMELLNEMFRPDPSFSYNAVTRKLIISGGVKQLANTDGGVIIQAVRKVYAENPDGDTSITVYGDVWNEQWLKDYATELVRLQWGQNLSKYNGIILLGGIQMTGESMIARAEEKIAKLEDQLKLEYETPPGFIIA